MTVEILFILHVTNGIHIIIHKLCYSTVTRYSYTNFFSYTPNTEPSTSPNNESLYVYIERCGNNHDGDESVYCTWSNYQFHSITNIHFRYNRQYLGKNKESRKKT